MNNQEYNVIMNTHKGLIDIYTKKVCGWFGRKYSMDECKHLVMIAAYLAGKAEKDLAEENNGTCPYKFGTLLNIQVLNVINGSWMKDKPSKHYLSGNYDGTVDDSFDELTQVINTEAINKGLYCLNDLEKQVIKFRYFDDLTYKEISGKMGISLPYAHLLNKSALEKLSQELGDSYVL